MEKQLVSFNELKLKVRANYPNEYVRMQYLWHRFRACIERSRFGQKFQILIWKYLYKRPAPGFDGSSNEMAHRSLLVENILQVDPTTILDFGCGWGDNANVISAAIPQVYYCGIDINKNAIQHCRLCYPAENYIFKLGGLECIKDIDAKSFDVVLVDAVLMFVTPQAIKEYLTLISACAKKVLIIHDYESNLEESSYLSGRWAHPYSKIFKDMAEFKVTHSYPTPVSGGNWELYGRLIVVKRINV